MIETYVSVDIEADGPIPGDYSMMSLGAVAYDDRGGELGDFSVNLLPLPDAEQHPDTMAWWGTKPEAFEATQRHRIGPCLGMRDFAEWAGALTGKPVFVGYPASFDFMFTHWYLVHFGFDDPFGFNALDIKTYAMARMGCGFKATVKARMPKEWMADRDENMSHVAVEDARSQGGLFFKIRESLELKIGRS